MEWYVLQVMTGSENMVRDSLTRNGIHAAVAHERRVLRSGGKWLERDYVVIPSYVFVRIEYTDTLYYVLKRTQGVIRILGTGSRPSPLLPTEEKWIESWEQPLLPSKIHFNKNGTYKVLDGPLTGENVKLLKLDRHRRRAKAEVKILGKPKITYLSLEILKEF